MRPPSSSMTRRAASMSACLTSTCGASHATRATTPARGPWWRTRRARDGAALLASSRRGGATSGATTADALRRRSRALGDGAACWSTRLTATRGARSICRRRRPVADGFAASAAAGPATSSRRATGTTRRRRHGFTRSAYPRHRCGGASSRTSTCELPCRGAAIARAAVARTGRRWAKRRLARRWSFGTR